MRVILTPPESILEASPKGLGNFAPWNYRADDYLMTDLVRMGNGSALVQNLVAKTGRIVHIRRRSFRHIP
jgi:hypothetical protein